MKLIHLKIIGFLKNLLVHLAVVSLTFEQFIFLASASDLPITPDGSTNTQIVKTASAIDQINIAAPNSNGLSRNAFVDYNVNQSGQIINNFSGEGAIAGSGLGAVTQTQIGGLVTTNPNLSSSGSALVILNEVTSNNVSKLLGYVEIAGTKADLILANPNGIACAGCGFINSSHLLMVAGKSEFDADGNLGFLVGSQKSAVTLPVPLITIEGLGLDVERVSAADIVAAGIRIISNIYGGNDTSLTLKTGEGNYDYKSRELNPNQTTGHNTTGYLFSIDASSLTKIQSGQIFLIATKEGLGVNMAGEILANNEIKIDVSGDIYYAKIASGNKAELKSNARIDGVKITSPNLTIEAGEFKNSGNILAYDASFKTNDLINSGKIEALNLKIQNINLIENSGLIYGQDSIDLSAADLINNASGTIYSANALSLTPDALNNSGAIYSKNSLNITAKTIAYDAGFKTNDLINSGKIEALNLKIQNINLIENSGLIYGQDSLNLSAADLINNASGTIYSANALSLEPNVLNNSGTIYSKNSLNITAKTIVNNSLIYSINDLHLTANSLINKNTKANDGVVNKGIISEDGKVMIAADSMNNDSGLVMGKSISLNPISGSSLNLAPNDLRLLTTNLDPFVALSNNSGKFLATASVILNLGNLDYTISGEINAGSIDITATNITNLGNVTATDFIKLNASGNSAAGQGNIINGQQNADNSNVKLQAGTYINLIANRFITNYGTIAANTNLTLTSNYSEIQNYGKINGGSGTTTFNLFDPNPDHSILRNYNQITSDNNLFLNASKLDNYGEISVRNNLTTKITHNLVNNPTALIWSGGDMALRVNNALINNQAAIYANRNLTIEHTNPGQRMFSLSNISGEIETYAGDMTIRAHSLENKRAIDVVDKMVDTIPCYAWGGTKLPNWNYHGYYRFGHKI